MARKTAARRKPAARAPRLDTAMWVEAALDALADGGVEAVRVEPLAKTLNVTKGSFYWHFPDRRALLDGVLTHWAHGRIEAIRQQAVGHERPSETLRRLAGLYTPHANPHGLSIELAVRALARTDAAAAKAVRAVDLERLKLVGALFKGLGHSAADAQARAILFYGYLFGESLLDSRTVTRDARAIAVNALVASPA